jgi:hypothetical protein
VGGTGAIGVTVRHGQGELHMSGRSVGAARRGGGIGQVVCEHAGRSERKGGRSGGRKGGGGFEYGLEAKEPVVSRGAPRLPVKQRHELVVAQLECTDQGCSITRIGGCHHANLCVAICSDCELSPRPSLEFGCSV